MPSSSASCTLPVYTFNSPALPVRPVHRLWQRRKVETGYDASNSRSVLHHALRVWSYWHEVYGAPKVHGQFRALASALARRALRGWRRWTMRTRLLAPTWQRCRIRPQGLPPLPASKPPARLQPRPALSHLAFGRRFWKGKIPYQRWDSYKHHSKLKEEWCATHQAMLQQPFILAPDQPWLRSWQISKSSNIVSLTRYRRWGELRPLPPPVDIDCRYPKPGERTYLSRNCRLPPTARFILCHYRQPHTWHEIRANVTSDDFQWTQWQESVVSTTVGSCQGSIRWEGIQPVLEALRAQLAVFSTSRRRVYRRHSQLHQRNWQPPRHQPGLLSIQPVFRRPSQPRYPTRPMSLVAGFPGFGTNAADLTALDQLIEQAAVRIQRAFRHFSRQRRSCLGSTVARPQPLTVCIQPEDGGTTDSGVDASVADTEASLASTLLVGLLLACRASISSFRYRRHPRRSVRTASESWAGSTFCFWAPRSAAEPRLLHCSTVRVGCTYRRKRLGLHHGCTDGTGFWLSLEP